MYTQKAKKQVIMEVLPINFFLELLTRRNSEYLTLLQITFLVSYKIYIMDSHPYELET